MLLILSLMAVAMAMAANRNNNNIIANETLRSGMPCPKFYRIDTRGITIAIGIAGEKQKKMRE